ncbi:MAG TPA: GLUG motif-containing protein [Rhizomicrobium sp.]|jgi:hypothetical protein|nr:GLUG motif-containing protein [Rhizomicrobium sp.]
MKMKFRARARALTGFCAAGLAVVAGNAQAEIAISSAATQNMSCTAGMCTPTAAKAVLNVGDLETLLASGNVSVETAGNGVQAASIKVSAGLTWSSTHVLTLDAWRSILIGNAVSVTGTGGLSVKTNDGGNGGALSFGGKGNVTFQSLSSSLSINGLSYTLVNSVAGLANAVSQNQDGNVALAGDYNAGGDGTYAQSPVSLIYGGAFEGLGHTIANLSIADTNNSDYVGLFYEISPGGAVADLNMSGVNINSPTVSLAGAIAGDNQGTIVNARSSGTVIGGQFGGGGVAGFNFGTIAGSSSSASVQGANVGGLIGFNEAAIINAHATGNVVAVTGPNSPIGGGLVGENQGTVETSWASGSVSGSDDSSELGGLIGSLDSGTLNDAYSTGAVTAGTNALVGGAVGYAGVGVGTSYSTGAPSGGAYSFVGGYAGYDDSAGGMKHDCWDMTTSGITDSSQGAGNLANDPGIKGLTTRKLQSQLPKGFSAKIWAEDANINGGLPYLRANPPGR